MAKASYRRKTIFAKGYRGLESIIVETAEQQVADMLTEVGS